MTPAEYRAIRAKVIGAGFAHDIEWAETVAPPESPEDFALEAIYVICNSGMKWEVAREIYKRVRDVKMRGWPASEAFGHPGKSAAIDEIWRDQVGLFEQYLEAEDKLAWLAELPWIGPITKYHLAKNFGVDCAKPDRHLVRIAERYQTTVGELCQRLSADTGDRIGTVDLVLWRAAEQGLLDLRSRPG